jgi:hypothetical protein
MGCEDEDVQREESEGEMSVLGVKPARESVGLAAAAKVENEIGGAVAG